MSVLQCMREGVLIFFPEISIFSLLEASSNPLEIQLSLICHTPLCWVTLFRLILQASPSVTSHWLEVPTLFFLIGHEYLWTSCPLPKMALKVTLTSKRGYLGIQWMIPCKSDYAHIQLDPLLTYSKCRFGGKNFLKHPSFTHLLLWSKPSSRNVHALKIPKWNIDLWHETIAWRLFPAKVGETRFRKPCRKGLTVCCELQWGWS